jgi:uncharacterized protein
VNRNVTFLPSFPVETDISTSTDASTPAANETASLEQLMDRRLSRRHAVQVGLVVGAATTAAVATPFGSLTAAAQSAAPTKPATSKLGNSVGFSNGTFAGPTSTSLGFAPIASAPVTDDAVRVPAGYVVDIVARWGDPIFADAAEFDLNNQTGASQSRQVGYNHDFQAFFPLGDGSMEGVLFINHEYTDPGKMIPKYDQRTTNEALFKGWVDIELEAHGGTVVELERTDAKSAWKIRRNGTRNRRITANTPMRFSGPAARDARLLGGSIGMLNNCGGGVTPWGTVLTCEENFNQYFANASKVVSAADRTTHARYGVTQLASGRLWERSYPTRFDASLNPMEPYKHGWVVEIDPDDPNSVPVKHTALGRFKHEAATVTIGKTGQVIVYSGDDERNDYFYKFVSWGTYDPAAGKANAALLSEGTLYAAKLEADGKAEWIPLVFNSRPELSAPRFSSQADILIRTREAGDAVKATRMDRPEDVETNPATGKVYVLLTNNSTRTTQASDLGERAANPRFAASGGNRTGHILELSEDSREGHAGKTFRWDIFMLAGDPNGGKLVGSPSAAKDQKDLYFAGYQGSVSAIGAPDNVAFSPDGIMWVASDGAPSAIGYNDGLHAMPTTGERRGQVLQFLSVPAGAETCGPEFTPDQKTLFIAVQHPGEDGSLTVAGDPNSNTQSSWPDGRGKAPRPASIAIRHSDGRRIGQ